MRDVNVRKVFRVVECIALWGASMWMLIFTASFDLIGAKMFLIVLGILFSPPVSMKLFDKLVEHKRGSRKAIYLCVIAFLFAFLMKNVPTKFYENSAIRQGIEEIASEYKGDAKISFENYDIVNKKETKDFVVLKVSYDFDVENHKGQINKKQKTVSIIFDKAEHTYESMD